MSKKLLFFITVVSLFIFLGSYYNFAPVDHQESEMEGKLIETQEITKNNKEKKSTQNIPIKTYRSVDGGFSLEYPSDLLVKEYDEGEGAHTTVFLTKVVENGLPIDSDGLNDSQDNLMHGFQIYSVPFSSDVITESRIRLDIPSGVFTKPIEIVIGNSIRAITFFSNGPFGEMREVWFIHKGFLYEVTTYKKFDQWLVDIMETWHFPEPL